MPQFKDREEYEKWKAERLKQAAEKTRQGAQEDKPPEPVRLAPEQKTAAPSSGLLPVGELFSVSWEIYRRRFGPLVGLYLISILLFIIPLAILLGGGFALGMLLFSQAGHGISLLLAGALIGLGYGNFISCAQAISIKDVLPHKLGLATATFFIFVDLGFGVGPYLLGFLIPFTGYRGLYLIMAILILATIPLYYFLYGRKVSS